MLTGTPPFEAAQREELYRRIRGAQYPLSPHLSPRARALIARLLAPEPTARPTLQDVLDHGFFTQGFTPATLPPRACRSVPVFVGQDPLCGLLRGAATMLAGGWPCPVSPRRAAMSCVPPAPRKGAASPAGPEPGKRPLRKTFISARNRLKSSH
ncbi:PREDICTED: inactive serine/threonine-protein kinase PLK5 [Calidris pugnax]|uniref:inactive serine/threonine-protein kinase PLK5 n=1 Tax=Calidris pugnax TaxID=198806 RepID=UPI00071C5F83|nr:PREDICTED: inactive serine/threonine-protein kinase PLK5 [Calidris pugnax]